MNAHLSTVLFEGVGVGAGGSGMCRCPSYCVYGDGGGSVGGIGGKRGGCVKVLQRSFRNTMTISYLGVFGWLVVEQN